MVGLRRYFDMALRLAGIMILVGSARADEPFSPQVARAIAKEAYVYGYPLVENYRLQYNYFVDQKSHDYKGGWNEIHHAPRVVTPADKDADHPNVDLVYSHMGADLRREPLVITVPAMEPNRYYAVQFIDMYTHNFAYTGSRKTGNGAGTFLLAGPDWSGKRPPNINRMIRSETKLAYLVISIQLFGPDDIEKVKQIQAGFEIMPLSRFVNAPPPEAPDDINFRKPLSAETERTSLDVFTELNFILSLCPPDPSEAELLSRLGRLSIGGDKPFDPGVLTPAVREAVIEGINDAWIENGEIRNRLSAGQLATSAVIGSRAHLQNNYAYRMAAATMNLYANSREEVVSAPYNADVSGAPLDGTHDYVLRFARGQLPPVDGFWSLTLYDQAAHRLAPNDLKRYELTSLMLRKMQRDPKGGVTLYVQNASPGDDKTANWLPAPKGPFTMALRMYWPKPEAFWGWRVPPLENAALIAAPCRPSATLKASTRHRTKACTGQRNRA